MLPKQIAKITILYMITLEDYCIVRIVNFDKEWAKNVCQEPH